MNSNKKSIILISGPSGVGKSTIINQVLNSYDRNLISLCISHTTRKPRNGEYHGREYFFIDGKEFSLKINQEYFLEYAQYAENFYGTSKEQIHEIIQSDKIPLLDVDIQGFLKIQDSIKKDEKLKAYNLISIFICPPSIKTLRERLVSRTSNKDHEIENRIKAAYSEINLARQLARQDMNNNISLKDKDQLSKNLEALNQVDIANSSAFFDITSDSVSYKYVVINNDGTLDQTIDQIKQILSLELEQNNHNEVSNKVEFVSHSLLNLQEWVMI